MEETVSYNQKSTSIVWPILLGSIAYQASKNGLSIHALFWVGIVCLLITVLFALFLKQFRSHIPEWVTMTFSYWMLMTFFWWTLPQVIHPLIKMPIARGLSSFIGFALFWCLPIGHSKQISFKSYLLFFAPIAVGIGLLEYLLPSK